MSQHTSESNRGDPRPGEPELTTRAYYCMFLPTPGSSGKCMEIQTRNLQTFTSACSTRMRNFQSLTLLLLFEMPSRNSNHTSRKDEKGFYSYMIIPLQDYT